MGCSGRGKLQSTRGCKRLEKERIGQDILQMLSQVLNQIALLLVKRKKCYRKPFHGNLLKLDCRGSGVY